MSDQHLSLRNFDIAEVDWSANKALLSDLREKVFIVEQKVPREEEWDGRDDECWHWLATNIDGQAIGTARLLPEGQIGRMAVLSDYRQQGIGAALLEQAVNKARKLGFSSVFLHAQFQALKFYQKGGFVAEGQEFLEADIRHQKMVRQLVPIGAQEGSRPENDHDSPAKGEHASENSGSADDTTQLLILRKEVAFQKVILQMSSQARRSIRLCSPLLDHKLYDNAELSENFSILARQNRYTSIDILVYDTHRMVKNGHRLMELSRKLSSSISIRLVHPDYQQSNQEYLLVDNTGMVYRQNHEDYEGYACFKDISRVDRLAREFQRAWDSSLEDPNLRQLHI